MEKVYGLGKTALNTKQALKTPPTLWGESSSSKKPEDKPPGYYSAAKLWITDALSMEPHPVAEDAFHFRGFTVRYVDVFGIISKVEEKGNMTSLYSVEDGTGQIDVLYSHQEQTPDKQHQDLLDLQRDVAVLPGFTSGESRMLNNLVNVMVEISEEARMVRKPGDSVHVIGKLCQNKDRRQVDAHHMSVTSVADETDRLLEMLRLYEYVYDKEI